MLIPSASVAELAAAGDAYVLDVRQPDEYVAGRVAGSVLMPLATVPACLDRNPRDQPVWVICHSGGRSAQATAFLRQRGYDARNVAGGIEAWAASGLPVERGGQ